MITIETMFYGKITTTGTILDGKMINNNKNAKKRNLLDVKKLVEKVHLYSLKRFSNEIDIS